MTTEHSMSQVVCLPESGQDTGGEVGGGDLLNRSMHHTSKYPDHPAWNGDSEWNTDQISY